MVSTMRPWIRGALLSLALSAPAFSQTPAVVEGPGAEASAAAVAEPLSPALPHFGLSLDVGIPDGAVLAGVVRPADWVRLSLGLAYNAISPGVRVGATFTPFHFLITPSLTVEAGHFFVGDPGSKFNVLVGSSGTAAEDFQHITYDYGNLHLGMEIGGARFSGFLHVGMSYVHAQVHDFQAALQKNTSDPTLEADDPSLRFTVPSLKLGLLFYFG
jgi:hypothetical protein